MTDLNFNTLILLKDFNINLTDEANTESFLTDRNLIE